MGLMWKTIIVAVKAVPGNKKKCVGNLYLLMPHWKVNEQGLLRYSKVRRPRVAKVPSKRCH